jgi:transcriptional antiterminator RfaH
MAEAIDRKFWEAGRAAAAQASAREVWQFPVPATAGTLRWHIVHVVAKFERGIAQPESFVAKEIMRAGFEVYSVRLRKMVMPRSNQLPPSQRQHRHMLAREKIEPMFPGYDFVRFDPCGGAWHDIFRLVGVYGMLCANNLPVPMPDAFIAGLRACEVNGAIPAAMSVDEVFTLGETVRITKDGPFKGLTGPIERLDERGRIRLLLALFGGETPIELTAADIEKL